MESDGVKLRKRMRERMTVDSDRLCVCEREREK